MAPNLDLRVFLLPAPIGVGVLTKPRLEFRMKRLSPHFIYDIYNFSGRCQSTFPSPTGIAATFNRSVWRSKGEVCATRPRTAFAACHSIQFSSCCFLPAVGSVQFRTLLGIISFLRSLYSKFSSALGIILFLRSFYSKLKFSSAITPRTFTCRISTTHCCWSAGSNALLRGCSK